MRIITENYHTHTRFCGHALGEASDYCRAALKKGLKVLGFTDHNAFPDDRWQQERMSYQDLPQYVQSIDEARENFPELTILKSMECDYVKEFDSFYSDELLGKQKFDYLLGAIHWFPLNGGWRIIFHDVHDGNTPSFLKGYADHYITAMQSGFFSFMAHPDVFGVFYLDWDKNTEMCARDILEAAADLKIPLEINSLGFRKRKIQRRNGYFRPYPQENFWELAMEYDVEVVISSDAHKPDDIISNMEDSFKLASKFGLKIANLSFHS